MGVEETVAGMVEALRAGREVECGVRDFPCIAQAIETNPLVSAESVQAMFAALGADDVPALEAAQDAACKGAQAWLGFKLVTDADAATQRSGEGKWMMMFDEGSADGTPGVFFADVNKKLLSARPRTRRDEFQMHDVTSGPSMHCEQFPGVVWLAQPLFSSPQVAIFGACDVAMHLADYASHVGFKTVVYDDDPEFLNEERFPSSRLVQIDFARIGDVALTENDYACVLTRGHVHDPEVFQHALKSPCPYVGMIGHKDKVAKNILQAKDAGISPERIDEAHSPIGIKFGAKTPAEIAVSIIAELIDVRYKARCAGEGDARA